MKPKVAQRIAQLEARLATAEQTIAALVWLNAERDAHLLSAFTILTENIKIVGWLHAEREHSLKLFIDSEERLIRRARAVKGAKALRAKQQGGVLQ